MFVCPVTCSANVPHTSHAAFQVSRKGLLPGQIGLNIGFLRLAPYLQWARTAILSDVGTVCAQVKLVLDANLLVSIL